MHQKLGGRDVAELDCGLGKPDNPTDGAAHAAKGGVEGLARHQGGPGRKLRPQGGCPNDGLARGVHARFAQESRDPARGRNGRDDVGACLVRKGVPGLFGDMGA